MRSVVRFNQAYRESVSLPGGDRVLVRLLRPGDRMHVDRAIQGLSTQTRCRPFHHGKSELSHDELHFCTNVDGRRRLALAVFASAANGSPLLVATARFVRSETDDTAAEAALTVTDDWQGRGVGKALLTRLVEAAAERRIQRLHFSFLQDNAPARRLLENCGRYVTFGHLESVIAAELHVPHGDQYAARHRPPHSRPRAYADTRPVPAPILSPLHLGLRGFGIWVRQTRDMLSWMERLNGIVNQRISRVGLK